MKLYLYSSQDLICKGHGTEYLSAGCVCRLDMEDIENVEIYPAYSSGIIIINKQILLNQRHNQIQFHQLSQDAVLCEIKPFVYKECAHQYSVKNSAVRLIENIDYTYIYFNNKYCGCIDIKLEEVNFKKIKANDIEYGLLYFGINKKYIILFDGNRVIYGNTFIDYEDNKKFIQIYSHEPNIFNLGRLTKFEFDGDKLTTKIVSDRGREYNQSNPEFNIIYFLEAIKCKRIKYAYSKLSYELKAVINIDVLDKYFLDFDRYIYISQQDAFITLKNNKVIGIYHFVVKDGLIDNIY